MKRLFLKDWKCCILQFVAVLLTIATMLLTTVENHGYTFVFSLAAILFIGLSMRRAVRVTA